MSIKSAIDLTTSFQPAAFGIAAAEAITREFTSPCPAEQAMRNM